MTPSAPVSSGRPLRRLGWIILAVSFGLRAWIAWRGGQLFWPDEDRFEIARQIVRALTDGRFQQAIDLVFGQPDHLLFKLASLIPAGLEATAGTPGWFSALFFAAASTWVLWLIRRAARAAGGTETEGLVALILAACTTSLFYYSRHFFPYDLSLGLLLLSLIAGLRAPSGWRDSFQAGLWAGLGYLAYNGYWTLGAALLVVHVLRALPHAPAMATRGTYALLGLALPIFAVAAVSRLLGHDFFALSLSFAGTVNQGDLGRAWEFVPRYLWAAEHGLALFWAAALVLSLGLLGRRADWPRLFWPGLTLLLAALLILPSDLLHRFALSARHVRVLTPFLCLSAASVLCARLSWRTHPRLLTGLLGLAGLQAAYNFAAPLAQVFPRTFEPQAARYLAGARKNDLGPYAIFNATFLHNPDWARSTPDPGRVLLRRPHPFQFTPYLFEGYDAATRARYQERDLSMRIVRLDAGGSPHRGYPEGMIDLTLRFPTEPAGFLPEPVLTTGQSGKGDLLFIRYEGDRHIRLGYDHIGGGAILSQLLPLDRSKPHRLLVGLGSFFTPGIPARDSRLFVQWDDTVALHGPAEFHPTTADQIDFGHNFIGASTAVSLLTAEITGFARLPLPARRGAVFVHPPGALRLELVLPLSPSAVYTEPLLSSGPAGRGDLLFLRSEGQGRFRLGHDHWGGGAALSDPFTLDPSRPVELVVAMGSFFPATETDAAARWLYVSCNGRIVFNRPATFHPTSAAELSLGENLTASTIVSPGLPTGILRCEAAPPGSTFPAAARPEGAVRLTLRFFGVPAPGQTEPLLATGRPGHGDLLFIRYEDAGHFRIGHDHWGKTLTLSEPQPFDPTRPLELTVAMGSLFALPGDPAEPFRQHLLVAVGDRIVLNQPARFHDAPASPRVIGLNAIGASTAGEKLSADVIDSRQVPVETIRPLLSAR